MESRRDNRKRQKEVENTDDDSYQMVTPAEKRRRRGRRPLNPRNGNMEVNSSNLTESRSDHLLLEREYAQLDADILQQGETLQIEAISTLENSAQIAFGVVSSTLSIPLSFAHDDYSFLQNLNPEIVPDENETTRQGLLVQVFSLSFSAWFMRSKLLEYEKDKGLHMKGILDAFRVSIDQLENEQKH